MMEKETKIHLSILVHILSLSWLFSGMAHDFMGLELLGKPSVADWVIFIVLSMLRFIAYLIILLGMKKGHRFGNVVPWALLGVGIVLVGKLIPGSVVSMEAIALYGVQIVILGSLWFIWKLDNQLRRTLK